MYKILAGKVPSEVTQSHYEKTSTLCRRAAGERYSQFIPPLRVSSCFIHCCYSQVEASPPPLLLCIALWDTVVYHC